MLLLAGAAALVVGSLTFLGRNVLGAMNELSHTVLTGRRTPPEGRHAWTQTPAFLGLALILVGVVLLAVALVRVITGAS